MIILAVITLIQSLQYAAPTPNLFLHLLLIIHISAHGTLKMGHYEITLQYSNHVLQPLQHTPSPRHLQPDMSQNLSFIYNSHPTGIRWCAVLQIKTFILSNRVLLLKYSNQQPLIILQTSLTTHSSETYIHTEFVVNNDYDLTWY